MVRLPQYKTRLCRNHEAGCCAYGARCNFAHGSSELRGYRRHEDVRPCQPIRSIRRAKEGRMQMMSIKRALGKSHGER